MSAGERVSAWRAAYAIKSATHPPSGCANIRTLHTRQFRYEWWLMKEAKARNPDIKLYGLSWAVPGWIGNGSYYKGDDNIEYHLKWIEGAQRLHNLSIDYIG